MFRQAYEESACGSVEPNPVIPTKQQRSDEAGHENPDAKSWESLSYYGNDKWISESKTKSKRSIAVYEAVKRWITGERNEIDDDRPSKWSKGASANAVACQTAMSLGNKFMGIEICQAIPNVGKK